MAQDMTSQLGSEKVGKLLLRLSIPAITAQVINALYNIIDRIYVGHIPVTGSAALPGIGLCFPIIILISAFSSLVGMGGAPMASIRMGREDQAGAERILGNCFCALMIISAALTTFFLVFKRPLLMMFGASENTIVYADAYLSIYLIGTVFVQISLGLNNFINAQGYAKTGMATVLIGAGLNIVLDPIFIFVFGMGVQGAAVATVISQAVSAIWVLAFLFGKKTTLKIRPKNLIIRPSVLLPVLSLGLSPFVMQSTESLLNIVLNSSLQKYGGDSAVTSMTILASVMQLVLMPLQGLGQGAQPITGYNYGAGQFDRVKEVFRLLIKWSLIFAGTLWALIMLFPWVFCRIFSSDMALVEQTVPYLRIYMGAIVMMGAQIACQQTFLALGQAKISLFMALLRKVVVLIPFIYILAPHFGVVGIFAAEPIADFIASVTTVTCFILFSRKIFSCSNPHAGSEEQTHL